MTIILTDIYVFGNSFIFSPGDWKSELLEYIDEDNLPEHYGGKCRDPDGNPKCQTKVDIDLWTLLNTFGSQQLEPPIPRTSRLLEAIFISLQIIFYIILPLITWTPDNSKFFLLPWKVRIIGSRLTFQYWRTFVTLERRKRLEYKCVPQLFLESLVGTRRSAIGQFFFLSLVTVPEVFVPKWTFCILGQWFWPNVNGLSSGWRALLKPVALCLSSLLTANGNWDGTWPQLYERWTKLSIG